MRRKLKDFFIPHTGNNFRPTFLERMSVGIMLVLVLLSFAMANLHALLWISSDWLVSTILPAIIVDLTNKERDAEVLVTLTRNPILDAAATLKAQDMAENGYFAHYSPQGVSPWYWFDIAGYNYWNAGENLAVHFTKSNEVVEAWMNSPSHRANIMNGQYTEIGVGTARGEYKGYKTIFVVQLFGTPRVKAVAGASTETPVTVEKVASLPFESDIAPATTETVTPEPSEVVETESVKDESPVSTESVVFTSDTATVRQEEGASAESISTMPPVSQTSVPVRGATESGLWLSVVYGFLASIVILSLIISLISEWRRHHLVQSMYAGGLLTVMAMLLYIHLSLTGTVVII